MKTLKFETDFKLSRDRGRFCRQEDCQLDRRRVGPRHRQQPGRLEDVVRARSPLHDTHPHLQHPLVKHINLLKYVFF